MPFTVVFSNGEPRDYGVFDKYQVTDAGVLVIDMHRADVNRHYLAPGSWLEVVEMADGQPPGASRGILGIRPSR
jgi:hypothetical protein